jgi:amidase
MEAMFDTYERFLALPDPPVLVADVQKRDAGRRPTPAEDPLNAVVRWCDVHCDSAKGSLAGLRVGMKDAIPIAGIPLTCGSSVLRDYVPNFDAELTRRVLDAGARIVAVTTMDAWAFSGGGETPATGPVLNPHDATRTACGSSNGSAAALSYPGFDLTWGTDTGGSVRIPASWCGVLGLKPTHGLIPFTGIVTSDWLYDHAGPMARTVSEMARAMDAVAEREVLTFGYPAPPRLLAAPQHVAAVEAAGDTLEGLRIGIVVEGFAQELDADAPEGTRETSAAVREAIGRLHELGARVDEVSVPELATGGDIMFCAMVETASAAVHGYPSAYHWFSESSPQLASGLSTALRAHGDEISAPFKLVLMLGEYLRERYGGSLMSRAHAMARQVRRAFDATFERFDVLVMPTTTHYAHRHLPDASISERALRGWGMLANAPAFNVTGHPALSMPAAIADGLPVGVMAVGRHCEDDRLLAMARTYERAYGWLPAGGAS